MEKQKRWQFYLIIAVLLLTLYNILPTVFYYSKPLKSPIDEVRAEQVAQEAIVRVDQLETDAIDWLYSFSKLIGVKPQSVEFVPGNHGLIRLSFKETDDAELFKRFLPQAGRLIPFVPAQLELSATNGSDSNSSEVYVQRNIALQIDPSEMKQLFQFVPKYSKEGVISDSYRRIMEDRVAQIALAVAGPSQQAVQMTAIVEHEDKDSDDAALTLAKEIVDFDILYGKNSALTKRYMTHLAQGNEQDKGALIKKFSERLEKIGKGLQEKLEVLKKETATAKEKNELLDSSQQYLQPILSSQNQTIENALAILKKNQALFEKAPKPLTLDQINKQLAALKGEDVQKLNLEGFDPFVQSLSIDWEDGKVAVNFYEDVQKNRLADAKSEKEAYLKEKTNLYAINSVARIARISDETFKPSDDTFVVDFNQLKNPESFLVMDLGFIAQKRAQQIQDQIQLSWIPSHTDFVRENYPVISYQEYSKLSPEEQKLGLVIYAPAMYPNADAKGFRNGSIYVIAKGMDTIVQRYKEAPDSPESQALANDFNQLNRVLQQDGFIGYSGHSFGLPKEFSKDYIFELNDYFGTLLAATREDFVVKGSKRYAVLDFTDVEQRILTWNRIEDRMQEDLVKWKEAYAAAQVDLSVTNHYTVPAPTKNAFLENFKLSFVKYFRGDDRKVLKWGLDLSGGKTVRIALYDQNNRPVTNPDDLNQAVNELYTRINKMGVAERTIRIENSNILLDFPGSQGLSASELVKASAMYFHIVNEKFSPTSRTALASSANQFLQDVWNEAVVTNRKDLESINEIAWQHLGGDYTVAGSARPRSEAAKVLYENGLRLANPRDAEKSAAFNDTLSSVAIFRGSEPSEWYGQTNPLLIVFHNFALEGSSLDNVQAGYDPTEGNILVFGVKSGSARDDLYTWSSQFSEEKIAGTPKEEYLKGRGWRMAVVLNGTIITAPNLVASLRDGGRISGRFSQREVNQLAADLKAGSLSYTPKILSEENVSPELGQEERTKGIVASTVALVLVVVAMVGYYRFAGLVASCAVLLNIFIMWGVLQNIDAAITLPGIAGIVLTIGMAVDANVLVFERVREEFKISGRISSALQAGYRKAFSAIIDSNITTILAALILIQFDSGPIKGFAITLIIGILSSMFTALFMTRYFFAGWVRNPNNKQLSMAQFLKETNFDFLGQAKKAIIVSLIVMALGTFFLMSERRTIFGMDFTGGYSLTVELQEKPGEQNYRLLASNALLDKGASKKDFEIRELNRPNQLRIQLGTSMNESGHPFYQMPETKAEGAYAYPYQKDPRLDWVVQSLQSNGLEIQPAQLSSLEKNWTIMSGQFSDAMRNNAILALAAALIAILIYITYRFEFKYAIGAVVGLVHDVVITLGILAFFHKLGFPVQIDLQVVGAIMTIIGYSLNDTIIVFDRIREDLKTMKRMPFKDVINHALNVTLSRTIMTSGTTLLVLLALVFLGGSSIFSFSLVMTVGVLVGTLSSLFIASPVMLYFHNRELEHHHAEATHKA